MHALRLAKHAVLLLAAGCVASLAVAVACSVWFSGVCRLGERTCWDRGRSDWGGYPSTTRGWGRVIDHAARRDRLLEFLDLSRLPSPEERREDCYEALWVQISVGREAEIFGVGRLVYSDDRSSLPQVIEEHAASVRAGWPLHCLSAVGPVAEHYLPHRFSAGALPAPGWLRPTKDPDFGTAIPTRIIPLNLAVNSAFYGALLGLPLALTRAFTRLLRLRRNHCPRCNYNRRGLLPSAPCPECGPAPGRRT